MARALHGPRPGVRPARRALAVADPGSESVGESWSRAQIIDAGLPGPLVQRPAAGISGQLYHDLRAMGFVMIRWTWATLRSGRLVTLLRPWLARHGVS